MQVKNLRGFSQLYESFGKNPTVSYFTQKMRELSLSQLHIIENIARKNLDSSNEFPNNPFFEVQNAISAIVLAGVRNELNRRREEITGILTKELRKMEISSTFYPFLFHPTKAETNGEYGYYWYNKGLRARIRRARRKIKRVKEKILKRMKRKDRQLYKKIEKLEDSLEENLQEQNRHQHIEAEDWSKIKKVMLRVYPHYKRSSAFKLLLKIYSLITPEAILLNFFDIINKVRKFF